MPSSSDICSSQSVMDETPVAHFKRTNKTLKQSYVDQKLAIEQFTRTRRKVSEVDKFFKDVNAIKNDISCNG